MIKNINFINFIYIILDKYHKSTTFMIRIKIILLIFFINLLFFVLLDMKLLQK